MKTFISKAFLAAATIMGVVVFGSAAQATIIDFEGLPNSSTQGSITLTAGGRTVTFDNVLVYNGLSNAPADESTVLFNAADPYSTGSAGPVMTITFDGPINNFFMNLFNGETQTVTYTVADNAGNSTTVSIDPNLSSGVSLISFPATGSIITITPTLIAGSPPYDYFIDNVGFDEATPGVPEPATWAMFLMGFGAIGWTMRSRRRVVAATA